MAESKIRESDLPILIAAIQNLVGPLQVDAEKIAKQLGMSLSSVPPKFTVIRKRYNIDIKVKNAGALRRNRGNTPKKRELPKSPKSSKASSRAPLSDAASMVAAVDITS